MLMVDEKELKYILVTWITILLAFYLLFCFSLILTLVVAYYIVFLGTSSISVYCALDTYLYIGIGTSDLTFLRARI